MDKKLFIVTNRKLIRNGSLADVIKGAAKGGADAVVLREKDLNYEDLYSLAVEVNKVIENNVLFIINNNIEVAKDIHSGAVHFSYDNFIKYKQISYCGMKGASIHCLKEAINVQKMGADYIFAGNIFNTACKPGLEGKGTDYLTKLCDNLSIPVIAIGGINSVNVKSVINAGAAGIAVMSSVMEAEDPEKTVYTLKQKLNNS